MHVVGVREAFAAIECAATIGEVWRSPHGNPLVGDECLPMGAVLLDEATAKTRLAEYGVKVPRGAVARTVDGAAAVAESLGGPADDIGGMMEPSGRNIAACEVPCGHADEPPRPSEPRFGQREMALVRVPSPSRSHVFKRRGVRPPCVRGMRREPALVAPWAGPGHGNLAGASGPSAPRL